MLTTGLLIASAGGAIAVADTEPTGSTTSQSQSADDPSQSTSTTTSAPAATTPQTRKYPVRTTIQGVLEKLRSLGKPVQKQPTATKPPTNAAVAEDVEIADTNSVDPPTSTDSVAPDSNAVTPESNENPPSTNFAAADSPKPNGPTPPTDVIVPALEAVKPVTNAVATVAGAALAVPGVIMAMPTSEDPVGDVITSMQNVLVSVNDVVASLAQMQGDLYSLLVVAGMEQAAVAPVATDDSFAALSTAAGAGLAPPPSPPIRPPVPPGPPGGGAPLLGDVVAPATVAGVATAGLSADTSLSGTAPRAVDGAGPTAALALLENTVKAVLAPVSLSALAAFALPGVGGLLIICAAGMRLGYRQAKASLAVRTTGIARFVRQGPIGIVRSGSLVALHTRTPRRVRPQVSEATTFFEQAA